MTRRIFPLVLLMTVALPGPAGADLRKGFAPCSYRENFESGELNAWASYPLWQDTAFDPNIRPGTLVAGDANISLVERVTPYAPVEAYAGAQKLMDAWLVPGSVVTLRVYLKTELRADSLKIRLAAGEAGTADVTFPAPRANAWQIFTARYEDFVRENPALPEGAIRVNALAVLVKFPKGDPQMPIYFGLDDVSLTGEQAAEFRFAEPAMTKLAEWKPWIPEKPYHRGETAVIRGDWPFAAERAELRIVDFPEERAAVFQGALKKDPDGWRAAVKLGFPEGLYLARMAAWSGKEKLSETDFMIHVAPAAPGGRHPRLWFDERTAPEVRARLGQDRFKTVRDGILKDAADIRTELPAGKVVFDLDRFPDDEPLIGNVHRSLFPWFDRVKAWQKALHSSALAFALCGDEAAGAYGKDVLIRLCGFPFWVHPWFEKRGQHTYYGVAELAMEAALAYDLLYGRMSEAERRTCRAAFLRNMISGCHRGYVEDNLVTSNTSNWVAHTVGGSLMCQAAIAGDGPDVAGLEPYFTGAVLKLNEFLRKCVGRDGGYGESLGYANFTMLSMSKVLPAVENVFDIDLSRPLTRTYQDFIWAGRVAERRFYYFGDSSGEFPALTNWAWLLAKTQEPHLAWLYRRLAQGETFMDVLYRTEDVAAADPSAEKPVRLFRDLGTTVFRSSWDKDAFVFVLRTGPFFNHQHLDQGTFWLEDGGTVFVGERHGSTYYDDPIYQSRYTQPVAHSTILIDRNPQSQRTGDPRLFAPGFDDRAFIHQFLDGRDAAFVSGDIGRLYWGKVREMRRNVLYLKPRAALILDTVVPAEKDVDVTLLFQAGAYDGIRPGRQASQIGVGTRALRIEHLAPEGVDAEAVRTPIYINTLKSENPLVAEGMLAVTARTSGRPLVAANLLRAGEPGRPAADIRRAGGCVIGCVDGRNFAFGTEPGRAFEAGGFSTDALALTWSADVVFAALARDLRKDGVSLVRSSAPMTFELSAGRFAYSLAAPANIEIRGGSGPVKVLSDGKEIAVRPARKDGRLSLSLEPGEGVIVFQEMQ